MILTKCNWQVALPGDAGRASLLSIQCFCVMLENFSVFMRQLYFLSVGTKNNFLFFTVINKVLDSAASLFKDIKDIAFDFTTFLEKIR